MKSKAIHQDVYISIVLYIVLAFFLTVSMKLPKDSAYFPNMLIIGLAILNTSVLLKGIKRTKAMRKDGSANPIRWEVIKKPVAVFGFTVIYIALFAFTNFYIATAIYMIGLMKFYKVQSWKTIILVSVIFNVFIYLGFSIGLNVPLI